MAPVEEASVLAAGNTIINQSTTTLKEDSRLFWPVVIGLCLLAICLIFVLILLCRVHKKAHEEKPVAPVAVVEPPPVVVAPP